MKGLSRLGSARGGISHFTRIDSAYEAPSQPDVHVYVQTDRYSVDQSVLREFELHDVGRPMTTARASAIDTRMERQ
ncbi:adenylyl-sulfate kinase [Xanthomonas pisi]|uniref:Adenylyl-sulfate kinase n=1 Tax=Xanthomonas pisi TaxID=56457 RepID=A0A2S7D5R8_9XANT|nr:adenylyl-sulfate kinase [Xanthomonas pisi]